MCVAAAELLPRRRRRGQRGRPVRARVVSLPSWDLFALQTEAYRHEVLPPASARLAVEAAASFGWERYADDVVAIDHFGASAPGQHVLEHFGYTPDNVAGAGPGASGPRNSGIALTSGTAVRPARTVIAAAATRPEGSTMTKLHDLYEQQGQSPWLDNLRRDYLRGGRLAELVAQGIRGVTSNPTIFAKAIESGSDYDEQFGALLGSHTVEEAYWELVVTDIRDALAVLRPVYDGSDGVDGFVSLEVAPGLAHDTDGTIAAARHFHELVDEPNLYVKIPATAEGVPAIRAMIAEGRNINITLLFSLERYDEVIEAYIGGLEDLVATGVTRPVGRAQRGVVLREPGRHRGGPPSRHPRRPDTGDEPPRSGHCAAPPRWPRPSAPTRCSRSGSPEPRWEALAAQGAKVQRPLWASTSTKNPAYPDLVYVDTLIGPDTVNTMPDDTIAAFLDHGTVDAHRRRRPRRGDGRSGNASARPVSTWRTWPAPSRTKGWRASPSPSTS